MSDWGWVAFGYIVVYSTLIGYVAWNVYQLATLSRQAALPTEDKPLAGADITAPQLDQLEEQHETL